jgi:hypothetical protein
MASTLRSGLTLAVAQVDEERITRVRKLPNIVLCRDQHVLRLRGGESLEVTLTDAT